MAYDVWVYGNLKLEKYKFQSIDDELLKNLAQNRADSVSANGIVYVTVWSSQEIDPVRELRFDFGMPESVFARARLKGTEQGLELIGLSAQDDWFVADPEDLIRDGWKKEEVELIGISGKFKTVLYRKGNEVLVNVPDLDEIGELEYWV